MDRQAIVRSTLIERDLTSNLTRWYRVAADLSCEELVPRETGLRVFSPSFGIHPIADRDTQNALLREGREGPFGFFFLFLSRNRPRTLVRASFSNQVSVIAGVDARMRARTRFQLGPRGESRYDRDSVGGIYARARARPSRRLAPAWGPGPGPADVAQ